MADIGSEVPFSDTGGFIAMLPEVGRPKGLNLWIIVAARIVTDIKTLDRMLQAPSEHHRSRHLTGCPCVAGFKAHT